MKKINIYLIFTFLSILFLSSCSETGHESDSGMVDLSFALDIPEAIETFSTYSDKSIGCIDLLIFDAYDRFVERIQVNAISETGSINTFRVRLEASATLRTIHIIANARDWNNNDMLDFSHITAGTPLATAVEGLTSETLTAGRSPEFPLVMWGQVVLPSITSSTDLREPIPMLRMTASMYITCDVPTETNGLNDFILKGFSVVNASDRGRVVPAVYSNSAITPSAPALPPAVGLVNYALNDYDIWAFAFSGTTMELYLYDKMNSGDKATALKIIVHAEWNGIEGYYPIWLSDGTTNAIDIIRNHRYRVTIRGVYGTGYPLLTEAIKATPAQTLIVTDTDEDITDIISDGHYILGVSTNEVNISGSGLKNLVTIKSTNETNNVSATSSDTWISTIKMEQNGFNSFVLSAVLDATSSTRTGTIIVRAGTLTRTIKITQSP